MIDKQQAENIASRLRTVEASLSAPGAAADQKRYREMVREHASLRKLSGLLSAYLKLNASLEDARRIADDPDADDDFRELARAEADEAEAALPKAERDLRLALMPPDPDARRNAMIEIRAGTGGDEAAIFAGDLYRMYSRYAEARGWKVTPMDAAPGEKGGYKEIVFLVEGDGAFVVLRYEGGVHRVQRVPETESQGRIHTSTITVAVLPEADEVDVQLSPADYRVDVFRSSGPGGQSVNTTDSAVRVTYKPGTPEEIVVTCQDGKSQIKNREKAMTVLRSRLYEREERRRLEEQMKARGQQKAIEWGSQIRSYVLDKQYVKDHRSAAMRHDPDNVLDGDIEDLIWSGLEWTAKQGAA